jgi:hypothetical protein
MQSRARSILADVRLHPPTDPRLSERIAKKISPYTLVIAMLVFLIPFASVSCATPAGYGSMGGGITAKYNGLDLAMGGLPTLEAPQNVTAPAPTADDGIPAQPLFTIALLLTAAAFVAALRARAQRAHSRSSFSAAPRWRLRSQASRSSTPGSPTGSSPRSRVRRTRGSPRPTPRHT